MWKKITSWILGTVFLALCFPVGAEQAKKIPRIGILSLDEDSKIPGPHVEALRRGLRELGYVEGKNIALEYRYAEGKNERFPVLVAELVQIKVDVLVLRAQPAIRAAKRATSTIPIIMVTTQDPVASGFIDSLARPGGNITGITTLQRELSGKRLELLREVLPGIARVGVLLNAAQLETDFKWYEAPARALKIGLQPLAVHAPNPDIEGAFKAAAREHAGALLTITGILLNRSRKAIADLAVKNRLASIHERDDYVEAGGLLSYSTNDSENFRRVAGYVDKILKGAKPADLPVEQPTDFDLVINLKTAKQIGLTIPPNVLARADRVIK
jgi:putative ABC transport system substrate-binding protein